MITQPKLKCADDSPKKTKGESAPDFSDENYEVSYLDRATMDDLSDLGKKQMGFIPW